MCEIEIVEKVVEKFGELAMSEHLNMEKMKRYISRQRNMRRVPYKEVYQINKHTYEYPASITKIGDTFIMDEKFQKTNLNNQIIFFHPAGMA